MGPLIMFKGEKPFIILGSPGGTRIFPSLTQIILNIIREAKETGIDQLVIKSGLPASKIAAALLNLEFEGIIKSLPGKQYAV